MKKITRKDSVVKITSLIGKNMTTPKIYTDIVDPQEVPEQSLEISQFDKLMLDYVKGYEKDLSGIQSGREGEQLKKKVDEEIAKRQKFYFGFIPANQFTHMLMLISIAVLMVVICSCWKYHTRKNEKKEEESKESERFFKEHNHSHSNSFTKSPKPKRS